MFLILLVDLLALRSAAFLKERVLSCRVRQLIARMCMEFIEPYRRLKVDV
jgi:hypothetical protein